MLIQVRPWLPQQAIVLVADSSFAALELLEAHRQLPKAVLVTRLRSWTLLAVLLGFSQSRWVVPARWGNVCQRSRVYLITHKPIGRERTTSALFGLFSLVVLAHQLQARTPFSLPQSAYYHQTLPTFVDALALVRQQFWTTRLFQSSGEITEIVEVPRDVLESWSNLLCYPA